MTSVSVTAWELWVSSCLCSKTVFNAALSSFRQEKKCMRSSGCTTFSSSLNFSRIQNIIEVEQGTVHYCSFCKVPLSQNPMALKYSKRCCQCAFLTVICRGTQSMFITEWWKALVNQVRAAAEVRRVKVDQKTQVTVFQTLWLKTEGNFQQTFSILVNLNCVWPCACVCVRVFKMEGHGLEQKDTFSSWNHHPLACLIGHESWNYAKQGWAHPFICHQKWGALLIGKFPIATMWIHASQ